MSESLPVLTFHSIDDRRSVISFSPDVFRNGMAKLAANGFRTIDLMTAVGMVRGGAPFPDRSLVITFDDGYRNTFDEAFPILRQHGMTATVFVTVGERNGDHRGRVPSLNGREMLSRDEMREMHASGLIRFGAHTLTHPDLTRTSAAHVDAEMRDSKALLEEILGAGDTVTAFAYPFGRYDEPARAIAARYFECACSDRLGMVTSRSDVFALERVDAYYLRTERQFDRLLRASFPRYVWARSVPRRIKRAIANRLRG